MPLTSDDNYKILIETTADTKGAKEAESSLKGVADQSDRGIGSFLKLSGAVAVGQAAFQAAGDVIHGVVGFLEDSVKSAEDNQNSISQLNAVLTSTKGVAGVTAKQVEDMGEAFQKSTKFSHEQTDAAESMLLTFTNIHSDVFPATTKAVLDMSTAMHQDLQSTAIQVGKALQDPVKGATALQRVGVRLTDTQKELIKTMVATGNTAGAQKVILGELTTEFGGSAEAAGNTFAGSLAKLNNQMTDVKETVGKTIIDAITPFAAKLADFVSSDKFQAWLGTAIEWLKTNLPKALDFIVHTAWPEFKKLFDDIWPVVKLVLKWIGDLIQFLTDHTWVLWGIVSALAAIKVGMMIQGVIAAFGSDFVIAGALASGAVTGVTGAIGIMGMAVAAPFAVVVVVAAALLAIASVFSAASDLNKLLAENKLAAADAEKSQDAYLKSLQTAVDKKILTPQQADTNRIKEEQSLGKPTGLPQYASGTSNAKSGLALVGENGPELVNFAGGETVTTSDKTAKMMGGSNNTFTGDIYLGDSSAVIAFFDMLNRNSQLVGRGLTPSKGY